jgi:hypothetical protein
MSAGEVALLVGLLANAAAIMCVGIITWISGRNLRADVKVVHDATNSMKDELVEEVRSGAFARGRKSRSEHRRGERKGVAKKSVHKRKVKGRAA